VKLRFTPRATRDLAEIAEYLHTRNPSAALAVRDAILRSLQNLTLFPAIGRPQNVQGVRKLVTPEIAFADLSDNAALAEAQLKYTFAAFIRPMSLALKRNHYSNRFGGAAPGEAGLGGRAQSGAINGSLGK